MRVVRKVFQTVELQDRAMPSGSGAGHKLTLRLNHDCVAA